MVGVVAEFMFLSGNQLRWVFNNNNIKGSIINMSTLEESELECAKTLITLHELL